MYVLPYSSTALYFEVCMYEVLGYGLGSNENPMFLRQEKIPYLESPVLLFLTTPSTTDAKNTARAFKD